MYSIQFPVMVAQTDVPVNGFGENFVESRRKQQQCATGQAGRLYIQTLKTTVPGVAGNRSFCLLG
jgi:hypothetical protein